MIVDSILKISTEYILKESGIAEENSEVVLNKITEVKESSEKLQNIIKNFKI